MLVRILTIRGFLPRVARKVPLVTPQELLELMVAQVAVEGQPLPRVLLV